MKVTVPPDKKAGDTFIFTVPVTAPMAVPQATPVAPPVVMIAPVAAAQTFYGHPSSSRCSITTKCPQCQQHPQVPRPFLYSTRVGATCWHWGHLVVMLRLGLDR